MYIIYLPHRSAGEGTHPNCVATGHELSHLTEEQFLNWET